MAGALLPGREEAKGYVGGTLVPVGVVRGVLSRNSKSRGNHVTAKSGVKKMAAKVPFKMIL